MLLLPTKNLYIVHLIPIRFIAFMCSYRMLLFDDPMIKTGIAAIQLNRKEQNGSGYSCYTRQKKYNSLFLY